MTSFGTKRKYKYRLLPFGDDYSFREIRKRHEHVLRLGNYLVFPPYEYGAKQNMKGRPVFKGYLPRSAALPGKVLTGKETGSNANPTLDKAGEYDDVPEYIYTIPNKDGGFKYFGNTDKKGVRNMKIKGRPKTERDIVDNVVAEYLKNNHYGNVIPVYGGMGEHTCGCCTERNRENVRKTLNLPTNPSDAAQPKEGNPSNQNRNVNVHFYHVGIQPKYYGITGLKTDPAFRQSTPETRRKWENIAPFEQPQKNKRVIQSNPDFSKEGKLPLHYHYFPNMYANNPSGNFYNRPLPPEGYYPSPYQVDDMLFAYLQPSGSNYASARLDSADIKYRHAMHNLRRYTYKRPSIE